MPKKRFYVKYNTAGKSATSKSVQKDSYVKYEKCPFLAYGKTEAIFKKDDANGDFHKYNSSHDTLIRL